MAKKMTADEKKWQAEDDARVLLQANEIEQSKARLSAALKQVKSIAKDAASTMKSAKKVTAKKSPPRRTTMRKSRGRSRRRK